MARRFLAKQMVTMYALPPIAGLPGKASCDRKYVLTVHAATRVEYDRERPVSAPDKRLVESYINNQLTTGSTLMRHPLELNKSDPSVFKQH